MEEVLKKLNELTKLTLLGAKQVLTAEDVCLLFGISKGTLHNLTAQKKIPYYKNGGGRLLFFKKEELENWLCTYRVPTESELEQNAVLHYMEKGGAK